MRWKCWETTRQLPKSWRLWLYKGLLLALDGDRYGAEQDFGKAIASNDSSSARGYGLLGVGPGGGEGASLKPYRVFANPSSHLHGRDHNAHYFARARAA